MTVKFSVIFSKWVLLFHKLKLILLYSRFNLHCIFKKCNPSISYSQLPTARSLLHSRALIFFVRFLFSFFMYNFILAFKVAGFRRVVLVVQNLCELNRFGSLQWTVVLACITRKLPPYQVSDESFENLRKSRETKCGKKYWFFISAVSNCLLVSRDSLHKTRCGKAV